MTRGRRRVFIGAASAVLAIFAARVGFGLATRITPPNVALDTHDKLVVDGPLAHFGDSYLRRRGNLWELGLSGDSATRGAAIATLMRGPMIEDEAAMYGAFEHAVPSSLARALLVDLGRLRFRHVDRGMPEEQRDELAGLAAAFQPDPFDSLLPTYHRFVFLYSVYDMALSFEKSPLIGCTTFTLPPSQSPVDTSADPIASTAGHSILARAFDFEAGEVFDRDKVVYLLHTPGKIPFASVGWPGFVGVVSGMNREGVAIVVHGGRAGTPRAEGMPVVDSLRTVLEEAHDVEQAIAILSSQEVMVSHIVIVTDRRGNAAIVERAPGQKAFVRRSDQALTTTNHFEGPLASDPHNVEVRETTSTLPRRARGDALVAALPPSPTVADAVAMLRDRKAADGSPLPLGDRRAIDALIATHGVVMDTTARALWVSEWPHLLGRFVRFDLTKLLADGYDPAHDPVGDVIAIDADPLDKDGAYALRRSMMPVK